MPFLSRFLQHIRRRLLSWFHRPLPTQFVPHHSAGHLFDDGVVRARYLLIEYISEEQGEVQDTTCGCGLGNQNPRHIVMECPLLGELRTDMWRDLCRRRVPGTLSSNQLLQEPKTALLVAEFTLKTGLLSQFQVVDPVATGSRTLDLRSSLILD
jgi:hypothetical protein